MPKGEVVEHRRNLWEENVEHNPSREAKHDHHNHKFILPSTCCYSAVCVFRCMESCGIESRNNDASVVQYKGIMEYKVWGSDLAVHD